MTDGPGQPARVALLDVSADHRSRAGHSFGSWIHQPLGLLYLAAYLHERASVPCAIRILNLGVDFHSLDELEVALGQPAPQLVGLRGLSSTAEQLHRAAAVAKRCGSPTVVAGGPYASAAPLEVMADEHVDFAVVGEGEECLRQLVELLAGGGGECSAIAGLCYRDASGGVRTNPPALIADLDAMPFPDYRLIDLSAYDELLTQTPLLRRTASLYTSRGCPFRCIYCHDIMQKKFRKRSAANVVEELTRLREQHGVEDFLVVDDCFGFDRKRAMDIFNRIVAQGLDIRLSFSNGLRGDILSDEMVDAMVEAGTFQVIYAVETASPRLQRTIKKRIDLDKLAHTIAYTLRKDIIVDAFAMVGFPTETEEEARSTLAYLMQFRHLHFIVYSVLKPYPGTEVYDMALQAGASRAELAADGALAYHEVGERGLFLPRATIKSLQLQLTRRFYLSRRRLEQVLPIQRAHLSERELLARYRMFHPRLESIAQLLAMAS